MWVFDATPLIYLAKAERLERLAELDGNGLATAEIYTEVVERGVEAGYPDARRIERLVENDVFRVVTVEETDTYTRLQKNDRLSEADASVLSCAKSRDAVAVMDETYGRDVAATEGIETRGTAFLVVALAKRGVIDPETARGTIDAMLAAGWYCAPDVYAKIVAAIEDVGT
jgi:predicted nucleic acid-binding protein